jgi:two-component system NarL family response regulator
MSVIRVLCVDDHIVVRRGLAAIINSQQDMKIVASVPDGAQAVEQYREQRPDITLMDLQLPGISGFEAIRQIRSIDERARIIVLTMYGGDEDIYQALQAGAATYLLKQELGDNLTDVIRDVFAGNRPLGSDIKERLGQRAVSPPLTSREVQVIELISRGLRGREVASTLGISEETVHVHVRNIFTKLQVKDRAAAIRIALERGFIHLN